uniref:ArnT family glycosyltransferase n=1 Tax=Pedobacter schmidteae TaxID=2201271 RepID=UPI0013CF3D11|nr:glycosyltransferase family 39 protein [Pedobacter schmidteae]
MGYLDLATKTLDYGQKAPIGFLWLTKLSIDLFSYSETALRLIPLLAGLLSLFVYRRLCQFFLNTAGQILAVSLFSFAPAIIYHSVEIKQYSTECLATILALYLFCLFNNQNRWKHNIFWGLAGSILIWFSFSVIFVLIGIATGICIYHLFKKDWKTFAFYSVPFLMWMTSFLLNYFLFTHKQESQWVVYFFKTYQNFMPLPPHSVEELKWFPRNFLGLMDYPLGLNWNFNKNNISTLVTVLSIIPTILLSSGILSFYKDQKQNFYVLICILLLTLLASGLFLYPLIERFWLFLVPIFILFVAKGFGYYQQRTKQPYLVLLFLLIISSPLLQTLYFFRYPEKFYKHKKSFEKEALSYIDKHFEAGDAVYNYWNNAPGYRVYSKMCNFKYQAVAGRDFRKLSQNIHEYNQNLKSDFKLFQGKKRVWLIFNNQFLTDIGDKIDDPNWYYKNTVSPNKNIYLQFSELGVPLKRFVYADITVCLFELPPI